MPTPSETQSQTVRKTKPKEFYALKLHALFDEIEAVMDAKVYATEQKVKSVQLLKCARYFVLKAFEACYAD